MGTILPGRSGLFSLLLSPHLQPPRLSQRLTPTRTWSTEATEATPTPMALPMAPTTPTTPFQSSRQLRLRGRLLTLRRRRPLCPSTTPSTTATTATHSPTTTARGRSSPPLMPMLMPRLTPGWHTVATLATPTLMATFPTTPTPWSPRRLWRPLMARRRRLLSHSPFPMAVSTTTAMATPATLLSSPSLARPSSPPSTVATTTLARGLLTPSLRPLLMLLLTLTLG